MCGCGTERLRQDFYNGFFIRFFFVCTDSPEINIMRIAKRYLNGGHEVPMSKVFSRYYKSIENASLAVEFADRAYIYDNSIEDQIPQLLYRTKNGKIVKQYTDSVPEWAKQIVC